MVKFSLKSFKTLALYLVTSNILGAKSQAIEDCKILQDASEKYLGENKVKFTSSNCCDLDVVTCFNQTITGIKLIGISCFHFDVKIENFVEELSKLENLESFELSNQSWCGRPKNISKLTNLKTLILSNNKLKDTLPEDLIQLTKLEKLDLSHNGYYNPIPSSYSKLTNLKSLILNNNDLSGNIPYSFKDLPNLTELNVAENRKLTGYIPKMPKITTCDYKNTELCSLKSTTCASNLKNLCTITDVQNTNKSNGNPNPNSNEYENDLQDGSDSNSSSDGNDNKNDSNDSKTDDTKKHSKGVGKSIIKIILIIEFYIKIE